MLKRTISLFAAAVLTLGLAGCNMVIKDEEKASQVVVAKVGETEITRAQVDAEYDVLLASYASYGLSTSDIDADTERSFKESILDDMVAYETMVQNAPDGLGVAALTDDELKEIDDQIESTIKSYEEYLTENAEGDTDEEKQQYVEESLAQVKETLGYDSGVMKNQQIRSTYLQKVKDAIGENYTPSDEEIQTKYDSMLSEQKEAVTEDMSAFSDYAGQDNQVYIPAGVHYVQNLLIEIPSDARTEISQIEDETENEQRKQEELAKIKDEADEALKKAQAYGADFAKLLDEYSDDPGSTSEPTRTEGYAVWEGNTTYVSEFTDAAMALTKTGEISGLVESDYGYHILRLVKVTEEGSVRLEDVKETIKTTLTEEYISSEYDSKLEEYKKASNVTEYKDKLEITASSSS